MGNRDAVCRPSMVLRVSVVEAAAYAQVRGEGLGRERRGAVGGRAVAHGARRAVVLVRLVGVPGRGQRASHASRAAHVWRWRLQLAAPWQPWQALQRAELRARSDRGERHVHVWSRATLPTRWGTSAARSSPSRRPREGPRSSPSARAPPQSRRRARRPPWRSPAPRWSPGHARKRSGEAREQQQQQQTWAYAAREATRSDDAG